MVDLRDSAIVSALPVPNRNTSSPVFPFSNADVVLDRISAWASFSPTAPLPFFRQLFSVVLWRTLPFFRAVTPERPDDTVDHHSIRYIPPGATPEEIERIIDDMDDRPSRPEKEIPEPPPDTPDITDVIIERKKEEERRRREEEKRPRIDIPVWEPPPEETPREERDPTVVEIYSFGGIMVVDDPKEATMAEDATADIVPSFDSAAQLTPFETFTCGIPAVRSFPAAVR